MSSSGGGGGGGGAADKQPSPSLTIDRAAFLLLRVKRVFRKKRQQRKEKSAQAAECLKQQQKDQQKDLQGQNGGGGRSGSNGKPAPLLRSRTLPAIVAPGLSILHAQIYQNTPNVAVVPPYDSGTTGEDGFGGTGADDGGSLLTMGYLQHQHYSKRDSSVSYCGKLLTPRISLADDGIGGERRVSDTGPNYRGPSGGRLSTCSVGGSQPLTRLARLLNQRPSFVQPNSDASPRRLSWERRDASGSGSSLGSTYLPRSSSIDSLADWGCSSARASFSLGWSEQQQLQPPKRSPSPMLGVGGRAERLASIASPAIGRRSKSQRVVLSLVGGTSPANSVDREFWALPIPNPQFQGQTAAIER